MELNKIASDESILKTVEALNENGFNAKIVNNSEEAKLKIKELIPEGSEVFTMTSVTLDTVGITEMINNSGQYDSVRTKLNNMDSASEGREMRKLGAAPDYAIGSVHAVTEDGKLLIASNTGSQLPAYAYGAGTVIWVVGANKIVSDQEMGMKRVYEHVLPLESERARKAYGVDGSFVSKLLIYNRETNPERAHVIIVKEQLGF